MVTASAVILNTIGLFYHVNYIRKALCCQVACPCPDVDAGLELMTPSRARVHHSASWSPLSGLQSTLHGNCQTYPRPRPLPAPTQPLTIPAAISSDILFLTRIDQLHCQILLLIVF